jgi:hypothetical protein
MTERSRQLAPSSRHGRQFAPSAPIGVRGWRFAHATSRQVHANQSQPTARVRYTARTPRRSLLFVLVASGGTA